LYLSDEKVVSQPEKREEAVAIQGFINFDVDHSWLKKVKPVSK